MDVKAKEYIPNDIKDEDCYVTIKERQPKILRNAAKYFVENYKEYLEKKFINQPLTDEQLSDADKDAERIYNEIMNFANKPSNNEHLTKIEDNYEDVDLWNLRLDEYVNEHQIQPDYLNTSILWTECFMYRSLASAFVKSKYFQEFDCFERIKKDGFLSSRTQSTKLIEYTAEIADRLKENKSTSEKEFENFICFALFNNRFDLSVSYGTIKEDEVQMVDNIEKLKSYIVSNSIKEVYEYFKSLSNRTIQITIVLDNSGFELIGDLCFIEMLYHVGFIDENSKIVFHCKKIPWFVSDVLDSDFKWLLDCLANEFDSNVVKNMAKRWSKFLYQTKNWELRSHKFWTTCFAFSETKRLAPDLYEELAKSDLVLFKGDLNYRKLISDFVWDSSTPFDVALRGFWPTNIVALRVIKCRPVVAIDKSTQLVDKYWINGEFGLVQFYKKKYSENRNKVSLI